MDKYNIQKEIWKDIKDYEGRYKVSTHGRIKSITKTTVKTLANNVSKTGYVVISLSESKERKIKYVHRLVAQAFLPNELDNPEVNHIDGDKTNNFVGNLEWCSRGYNRKHAYDIGLSKAPVGERQGSSKLTDDDVLKIRRLFSTGEYTQLSLAKTFGVNRSNIGKIIARKTWKHI